MQCGVPRLQPDEQAAVGILQHLSKSDLQDFLDDDAKLNEHINDLAQVKKLQTEKDLVMASNKSLAEYNCGLQPKFDSLKQQLGRKYEEANTLKTNLAVDKSKLDSHRGDMSLDTVSVLLKTAAAKTEEEAEDIASDFCDKKMDVDTFLEQFIAKRTEANLRSVKSQKMTQLMREQAQSNQNYSNWTAGPKMPSVGNSYTAGGLPPYPSGASSYPATYAMPQAGYFPS